MHCIRLSVLAEKSGIPFKKMLHEVGINRKTWENWLWGITAPNPAQRDKLAELLNCSVADINEAVAHNRERWIRQHQTLVVTADDPKEKRNASSLNAAEILVQIIVSVVTSVLVTLWLSGKL